MTPLKKKINKASELLAKREDDNEYHLHDVDRKWVIEAMMEYAEYILSGISEKPTSQTEISNEEILKGAEEWYEIEGAYKPSAIALITWLNACKWYRAQLKTK